MARSMLEGVTTKSDILRLLGQHGALTDSDLARLLDVRHQQVNQAARSLAAIGAISRVPGPDGVLLNRLTDAGVMLQPVSQQPVPLGVPLCPQAWPVLGPVLPGTPVTRKELTRLGFVEHHLELFPAADVAAGGLIGWNTVGSVPNAPGLYCFVGEQSHTGGRRVFYVGMTTNLWMVTKGQLPGGAARGGQRYGRPKHAGKTRQRVNAEVARLASGAWIFSHWLAAAKIPPEAADLKGRLLEEESRLIEMWNLRVTGWNRS